MKKILALAAVLICTPIAMAQLKPAPSPAPVAEPEQKSDLEDIIVAMAEQYAKSAAQDLAMKEVQTLAAKALSEYLAKQVAVGVSSIIAIAGLVENIQAYGDASTEGRRYSAFAHGVANTISIAAAPVPIIGFVAQMAVLGQDLTAAFVSKQYMIEHAKLRAQISGINKETSDLQYEQYAAETKMLGDLIIRIKVITDLGLAGTLQHEKKCEKLNDDYRTSQECVHILLNLNNLMAKQMDTIALLLNINGRFINATSMKADFKKYEELFNEAKQNFQIVSSGISSALNQTIFEKVLNLKNEAHSEILNRSCDVDIHILLKKFLFLKKEYLASGSKDVVLQLGMQDKKRSLENLVQRDCAKYLVSAPPIIKSLTSQILK